MTSQLARLMMLICLMIAALGSCGCTAMLADRKADLPLDGRTTKDSYTIQIDSVYTADELKVGELKEGLTIQGALDEYGLTKQYRTAEITLLRPVPEKGQVIKMACEFQPGEPLIKFEQDYALHAGDRILIRPKKSMLEKLVDR